MQQRDPNRYTDTPGSSMALLGILIAALVFVGLFVFWPRGTTPTGTAMRDTSPKAERPAVTPAPAPTTPAPAPAKPPAQ